MTANDFIKRYKLDESNIEEKIKEYKKTWWGSCGGDVDFQCSPKGITFNGVFAMKPERGLKEEFVSWSDLMKMVVEPQQITLW